MGKKAKLKNQPDASNRLVSKKGPKEKKQKKVKHKWNEKRKKVKQEKPQVEEVNVPEETTPAPAPTRPKVAKVDKFKTDKNLSLRERMMKRLEAAKFRQVNEELDNVSYDDPKEAFGSEDDFRRYHDTYRQRIEAWPTDPLTLIINWVKNKVSRNFVIADFGCGEARLAASVPHKVHSFDLYAINDRVTACDMSNCPLPDASVDVAIFSLSLMGIDVGKFIAEANRVLRQKGTLKIAEVASRFQNNSYVLFSRKMKKFGFVSNVSVQESSKHQNKTLHTTGEVFFMFEFVKIRPVSMKGTKVPPLKLNPSVYKRR